MREIELILLTPHKCSLGVLPGRMICKGTSIAPSTCRMGLYLTEVKGSTNWVWLG